MPFRDLRAALAGLVGSADFAGFTLATVIVYVALARAEGLRIARHWALMVGGGVFALTAISSFTGYPLGRIQYSGQLGIKLGPVPVGLLFLWFTILIGARETLLRFFRRASHSQIALGTGVLALLTDLNLEPVAARMRGFWFWRAADPAQPPLFTPPVFGYLAWFVAASALSFFLRDESVVSDPERRSKSPILVFALLNALLLAGNLVRWSAA